MTGSSTRICLGVIVGAHGIRGAVRVKCFTDQPQDLGSYGAIQDEGGQRRFKVRVQGVSKGLALVALDGVQDRNQAEAMKGVKLYVDRSQLPAADDDEFLVADLIGCHAVSPQGQPLGRVENVFDFGAGEVLEIVGSAGAIMVPFTRQAVPQVDIGDRRVVIEPPVYAADDPEEAKGFELDAEAP